MQRRSLALFIGRYLMMGFSIASIMLQVTDAPATAVGLTAAFSPIVPTIVYFVTAPYTEPARFHSD